MSSSFGWANDGYVAGTERREGRPSGAPGGGQLNGASYRVRNGFGPFSIRAWATPILLAAVMGLIGCDSPAENPVEVPVGTEVGLRAPPLTGTLPDGSSFDLAEVDGVAVLVFYRTADCGLCRLQLDNIQQHLTAYEIKGVRMVGVTLDPPQTSERLIETAGIGYPLVSVDSAVFERWGAISVNGEGPLPATYIVDGGLVRFRHIGRNASDRTTDAGVLTVIESLEG